MPYIGSDPSNRFVAPKAASVFSGDGSTTAFTLDHAVGSDEDILVSVDGVIQEPSVAYAVSNGTTLTFTGAPSSNSGNNIFVYYLFRTVGTVSHPSNNALTATNGTLTGTLAVTGTTALTGNATMAGTLNVTGETTLATHLNMGDSDEIKLGAGVDMKVFSDGTNGVLRADNGRVYVQTDTGVNLTKIGNAETMLIATPDGSVDLYHNNVKKFETASTGITVTGRQTINHDEAGTYALYVYHDGDSTNRYGIYLQVGDDDGTGTSYLMGFNDGDGNSVGSITFSGSNASFNTSSDYRLKNNIADVTDATAKLKELKPKKFSWKKDTNNTLIHGFLAHEVSSVVPEAVVGEKDAVDDDGKPIYQGIDHSKLVPLLVKTIQELEARITALESK